MKRLILSLLAAGSASAAPVPITHHRLETALDVAAQRITVQDDVTLAAVPRPGEPWRFLLHADLAIEDVRHGEVTLEWDAGDGWNPRHFWRRPPYAELARFEIAREVEVSPPPSGWGDGPPVLTVRYAGVIADSLHSPERAYGRSFEWTSGRIVEAGAFLSGSTFWIPWAGDDPFRFDLTVTSSVDWRVVSEGDLAADEASETVRTTRWTSEEPMEEIHLIAGPYRIRTRDHRGVDILTYCYENTPDDITDSYLDAAGESIDRFAELFGPYPFGKFALVENYWQTGYGMPSFTFLGDRVIRLPFIVQTSYPHEILHNWWGNGVYVQWDQGNWCEGLTTYCADYLAKERENEAAARDYRRTTLTGYRDFAAAGGKDFPLVRFRERDSAATQAVGYGKTLMVFHMLRRRLGDETFFASLRRLYETKRFQRASWDDVRVAFEEETGEPFEDWFEQWVHRPGAPTLSLHDVVAERGDGGWVVRGELRQEEPCFDVEVPLVVRGADANVGQGIRSREPRTAFEVVTPFPPERIAADADFDLFRLLHGEEVPAALSGVLGAAAVRIVVGDGAEGDVREALLAVAREWASDSTVTFVEEGIGEPPTDFDGGTWCPSSGTFVGAGRIDGDPARPAAVLLPAGADGVEAVARKVHHYSKYGFLVFDGERNVEKGSWESGESPLVVAVDAQ